MNCGDLLFLLSYGGSVNVFVCRSMPDMIIEMNSATLENPAFLAIASACASMIGSGLSGSPPLVDTPTKQSESFHYSMGRSAIMANFDA